VTKRFSGRGSVWLERSVRDAEVDSSNLSAPTKFMKKQIHAYFSGTVQGVGFRFTAQDIASDLGIKGWVKNLRDKRVEVTAEAEEEALKDFLDKINQYFSRYIQKVDIKWLEPAGEFIEFSIEY
jgi:acylphosphatase